MFAYVCFFVSFYESFNLYQSISFSTSICISAYKLRMSLLLPRLLVTARTKNKEPLPQRKTEKEEEEERKGPYLE